MSTLVESWMHEVKTVVHDDNIIANEVRIGVFYTAARLSTGHVGVAFTPRDLSDTVCCPKSAASAPPAGKLSGQNSWVLAHYAVSPGPLRRAVGVAVLNALSALALERQPHMGGRIVPGLDALTAAEIRADDAVAMVGAFVPFMKKLKGQVASLRVIDKHREALKADEAAFWRPPELALPTLSEASVVIITGSALVEGGLDALLEAAHGARRVVLAGPTASPWPPPFFARGVHVLGGIRVMDGEKLLQLVSEGGSGYFFDTAAEKVCVIRDTEVHDERKMS
ncbi:MAG TPA: DUF364 domain-containing protein [Methylomirabilota bacterium]|jgi:uncharacterized protein (DUF4213/DUF364 family)|nr:DUF364 domain-containing protein [Methylomirabilota bacterium]